jgi:hypothetical protein
MKIAKFIARKTYKTLRDFLGKDELRAVFVPVSFFNFCSILFFLKINALFNINLGARYDQIFMLI